MTIVYKIRSEEADGATSWNSKYLKLDGAWSYNSADGRKFSTEKEAADFLRDTESSFGYVCTYSEIPDSSDDKWVQSTDWVIEKNTTTGETRHRFHSSKKWTKGLPVLDQLTEQVDSRNVFHANR